MKTLTKPYDLFDLMKSNFDYKTLDNFFYPQNYKNKISTNIKDYDDHVSVEMIVPGFQKDEIEICIQENLLKIKGEKVQKTEVDSERLILNEFKIENFSKNFNVNPNLNFDEITSNLENGILNVKIPKVKKIEKKKIIKIE